MKNQNTLFATIVCVTALFGVATASTDLIVISPTPLSSDPDEQVANSTATLNAFQQAIDNAPLEGRTIQLEPGVYDFSAVVILDPKRRRKPPENYSVGLDGAVHFYNPHGLQNAFDGGAGIAILGKENLTIRGADPVGGAPTSIIRGCTDPRCLDFFSAFEPFNLGFTMGGDFEKASRFVTVENIGFESFGLSLVATSDLPIVDPRYGVGTEDLLIQHNTFIDVVENFIGGKQLRPVVRGNKFVCRRPLNEICLPVVVGGDPSEDHPVDALIEENAFEGGNVAVLLNDQQEGTVVRDNHFEFPTGDFCLFGEEPAAIAAVGGTHSLHPPIPARDGLIIGNTIDGGCFGIAVFGNSGWEIRHNRVNHAFIGVWTEWGPFLFLSTGIVQPTVAENNLVTNNDLRFNTVGVLIGARGRNNTYQGNNVDANSFAGYFLNGTQTVLGITFGPASGNTIIGATLQSGSVIDDSGCYPGLGGCPQIDEDGDGLFGEDPVDNINNDGDLIFGFSFNDEDLEEVPNFITGLQAVHGPVAPPWAQPRDSDGDELPDGLEFRLLVAGFCLDPNNADTDGDGITDADEFRNGTLESCLP